MRRLAVALALLTLPLAPQWQRGKTIYTSGTSSQSITATLGPSMDAVPAAVVPCANCHGDDGRGKAEGGVRPADISPQMLARSATVNGRIRAAYSRAQLKRAITMGFDASRNPLSAAMPRYQMTLGDADALLAYLEILGHESQPGVTADTLRIKLIGATLPSPAMRVYGRTIELVHEGDAFMTIDASDDPAGSIASAEREHIPTIVLHAQAPLTTRYAFSLTASDDDVRAALQRYGDALPSTPPPLLLLTAAEARLRDVAALPKDARVIVAAPLPPDPAAKQAAVAAAAAIVVKLLAQLGRDATQSAMVDALEHVYQLRTGALPPITWDANRHHGTSAVWLMTLDVRSQRLLAQPGWLFAE